MQDKKEKYEIIKMWVYRGVAYAMVKNRKNGFVKSFTYVEFEKFLNLKGKHSSVLAGFRQYKETAENIGMYYSKYRYKRKGAMLDSSYNERDDEGDWLY